MTLFLMNLKQCAEWLGSQTYDVVGRRHNFCNLFSHIVRCSTMEFKHDGSSENRRGGRVHAEKIVRLMEQVYLLDLGAIAPLYPQGSAGPGIPNGEQKKQQKKSLKSRPNGKAYIFAFCFFMQDHNYASRYRSYIPFFLLL